MLSDFSSLLVINVSAPAVCSCHDLVVDTDRVDGVDTLLLCLSFQFCLCSIPLSMFVAWPCWRWDPRQWSSLQKVSLFFYNELEHISFSHKLRLSLTLINYTVQPFDTLNIKCFQILLDFQIDAIMKMAERQRRETGRWWSFIDRKEKKKMPLKNVMCVFRRLM